MLVFLFVVATASIALPVTNAVSNCGVCELGGSFNESNDYGCFHLTNGSVACTCPDGRYKFDERCRICDRENICGDNSNNACSELSPTSLGSQTDGQHYFACFCTDDSFYLGEPCPSTATTTTTTTTVVTTAEAVTSVQPNTATFSG